MTVISIVLVLLLAIVVSSIVARMLPVAVPTPLIQIVIGIAIGLTVEFRVRLEADLFLLLFLPPLLFLDAWRIPKDELRKNLFTVVELALGLVLLTVIGVGFFLHWLIPAMPLAVAFALAAVLSPTDPIAVSSIASRTSPPRRMLRILEGEALLNDASGLVCLRFAVAAVLTGGFSLLDASLTFLWLVAGGLAVGAAMTLAATRTIAWVAARYGDDASIQILVAILTPFAAYMLAEHIHCSGILAAVAAGLAMSFADASRHGRPAMRIERHSIWNMIHFALNGTVFVLLGEQLTLVINLAEPTARTIGLAEPWMLVAYVLAIVAVLASLRFTWVWASMRMSTARRPERFPFRRPPLRLVAAMSLSGVRGVVTLAGVLTIPFTLADGTPFPARQAAIFLATGVIVVSLLLASISLPWLMRGLSLAEEEGRGLQEGDARAASVEAAIREVERRGANTPLYQGADMAAAIKRIAGEYRDRLHRMEQRRPAAASRHRMDQVEGELRLAGIQAERGEVLRLARDRRIGNALSYKLLRELDVAEVHHGP